MPTERVSSGQAIDDEKLRERLVERIGARRSGVALFLDRMQPRRSRLMFLALVSSAAGAALAAGPGFGGEFFTDLVGDALGLTGSNQVWQALCIGSVLLSGLSAYLTNVLRTGKLTKQVTQAETSMVELDNLATMVEFRHVDVDTAVKLYQEHSAKISFIRE